MKKLLITTIFAAAAASACGNPDASTISSADLANGPFSSSARALTQAEASDRAAAILSGTAVSTDRDIERGLPVFEVDVVVASGAVFEVKIDEATGQIVEIEGKRGPFDVPVVPGNGFITLEEATAIAVQLHPGATLAGFELELDDGLRWKYELDLSVDGVPYKVELDAITGALLEDRLESEAGDDHGGNGADDAPGDDNGGNGADDAPGDDNGGNGADDGPGDDNGGHGGDDAPGDDNGGE